MSEQVVERKKKPDLIVAGFHRLDRKLEDRPPKIRWGPIYRSMGMREKLRYLEKLAAAMNHAAHIIQGERNQWAELAAAKEQKIIAVSKALRENNAMIQAEITKMNEERQHYFAEIKALRDKLRETEERG